ncbi:alpha/beta fold hydrolase [Erythrobacter sp. HKB08]|uniref:alpha/beta fold hydrolase n=1 Tax=Erythrobacter sp. HKB08 TaxID=2502843 RepID=UPI001F32628F|nr:alpha/beta hydrolase [Erythrobacter sp. HKB08]
MLKWTLRILGVLLAILVIAFLLFRAPDTDPAEMRAKYGGESSQFVALDKGLEVHLRDEGPRDAPAIILLHGSNADLHTWQAWADGLAEKYRVIRFDQRGHGLTGGTADEDYATAAYVADVDRVADHLGLEKFVLAGNSMGGGIAMQYALDRPERLAGLVLVDAGGAPVKREGGGNMAFTLARIPGVSSLVSQILPRSLVERSLKQSVSNQDVVTEEAVDRYWELARYPGNRTATRQRFGRSYSTFTPEQIAQAKVPTLVVWGEEDSLIPYSAAQWYMEHLPNATLANFPGIGHLPQEEAPEQSLAALTSWLDGLQLTAVAEN